MLLIVTAKFTAMLIALAVLLILLVTVTMLAVILYSAFVWCTLLTFPSDALKKPVTGSSGNSSNSNICNYDRAKIYENLKNGLACIDPFMLPGWCSQSAPLGVDGNKLNVSTPQSAAFLDSKSFFF